MDVQQAVEQELSGVSRAPTIRAIRLAALARLPVTKADIASEAQEFRQACQHAEQYGDRLRELIDSPDCMPDPAVVRAMVNDYEQPGTQP